MSRWPIGRHCDGSTVVARHAPSSIAAALYRAPVRQGAGLEELCGIAGRPAARAHDRAVAIVTLCRSGLLASGDNATRVVCRITAICVAQDIVENCGNTLILRCSASEHGGTSEFASKLIGQREVMHTTISKTRGAAEMIGSTTTGQHLRIEPAIMASEIERLPDLSGFLKLASIPDWQAVRLTPLPGAAPVRRRKPVIVASPSRAVPSASPTSTPPAVGAPALKIKSRRGRPPKAVSRPERPSLEAAANPTTQSSPVASE